MANPADRPPVQDPRSLNAHDAAALAALRARLAHRLTTVERPRAVTWRARARRRLAHVPALPLLVAVAAITLVVGRLAVGHPERDTPSTPPVFTTLPNRAFTPGAAMALTTDDLCAGQRRASNARVPHGVRTAVLRHYRMEHVAADEYELDYLITPELGGVADERNLWPERYTSGVWNARVKDDLEVLLPELVCRGEVELGAAQRDIAHNWIAAYKKYFRTDVPLPVRARAARGLDADDDGVDAPGARHAALVLARASLASALTLDASPRRSPVPSLWR